MSNPSALKGFGSLLNVENIDPSINVRELEKQICNEPVVKETDHRSKFSSELKTMAASLGVTESTFDGSDDDDEPIAPIDQPKTDYSYIVKDTELFGKTQEQERMHHIDKVIGSKPVINNNYTNAFSFETEKIEDKKCAMLADIDSLIETLALEGADLSRLPTVDQRSDYHEVETVLKILRQKNFQTRYRLLAEEIILSGAYAVENLFDGERTWFGRQPDLTGWHNHVQVKLRRMRDSTGEIVSSFISDHSIGPVTRLLMELVPSLILLSRMNAEKANVKPEKRSTKYSEDEMNTINSRLRDN